MKIARTIMFIAAPLLITACGSNIEWFPSTEDTVAPTVTATIDGKSFSNNTTLHISNLTSSVIFTANETTTVYYTTDNTQPTTSSTAVSITSSTGVTGPLISVTNTILRFFGKDSAGNVSTEVKGTIVSP